jgi:hypothetical protein
MKLDGNNGGLKMALLMLAIGLLLGFGPAFAVGYFSWSWWWIVALAIVALLFNNPITLYNNLRSSWRNGHALRGLFYSVVLPVALQSAFLTIFYGIGHWLGS